MAYSASSRWMQVGSFALMPIPTQEGAIVPPWSVLAPESALGAVPTGARSSAQVRVVVRGRDSACHCASNSRGVR